MHRRFLLVPLMLAASLPCGASPGMEYMFVYQCHADEIVKDILKTCTSTFPRLAPQADNALAHWLVHGAAKAAADKEQCARELAEEFKSMSPGEVAQAQTRMAGLKETLQTQTRAEIAQHGQARCVALFKRFAETD
jgi:hypothetical protein